MSERRASRSPLLAEEPVGAFSRAAVADAEYVVVLDCRRRDLAVPAFLEDPDQGKMEARSSRISSGSTSRVPGGIGWIIRRTLREIGAFDRLRGGLGRDPFDLGAEATQALVDLLVATVDLADVADL